MLTMQKEYLAKIMNLLQDLKSQNLVSDYRHTHMANNKVHVFSLARSGDNMPVEVKTDLENYFFLIIENYYEDFIDYVNVPEDFAYLIDSFMSHINAYLKHEYQEKFRYKRNGMLKNKQMIFDDHSLRPRMLSHIHSLEPGSWLSKMGREE